MLHHKLGEARRQSKVNEPGVLPLSYVDDDRDAVHVALYEVAAEPVADTQGTLEIHAKSAAPLADCRPIEGRRHSRDSKPSRPMLAHG